MQAFQPFSFMLPTGARIVEIEYTSVATCPVIYYTPVSGEGEGSLLL